MVKFTISETAASGRRPRKPRAGTPRSTSTRMRALLATRQLPPLPAAFPNPSLTVHLNFQYTQMNRIFFSSVAARLPHRRPSARRRRRNHRAAAPPSQQPSEVQHDDQQRRGRRAAALRRARLHRAVERRGDGRRGQDDRAGAVGRSELRARVRAHSPRHLRHDSGGHLDLRRAVRSLARAERRRRHRRHRAEDRHRRAGRGAAVQRAQPSAGVRPGVQRVGREQAAVRAHDLRRNPPAAARAARRRADQADLQLGSRRRADERARSRTATSRRSTSPTTTARTSGR